MERVRRLVDELVTYRDVYGVKIVEDKDVLVIDAGVDTRPGLYVGKILAEITMCGLAEVHLELGQAYELTLPRVHVVTDYPVVTIASQLAAWILHEDSNIVYLSGPGRIVARKPKKVFEKLEKLGCVIPPVTEPVLIAECSSRLSADMLAKIREALSTVNRQPTVILTSTRSYAGVVQVCARVLEVCMLRLFEEDFDITRIRTGAASVLLPPVLSDELETAAMCNDAILLTGQVLLVLDVEDIEPYEQKLRLVVRQEEYSFRDYVKKHGPEYLTKVSPDVFRVAELVVMTSRGEYRKYGMRDLTTFLKMIA